MRWILLVMLLLSMHGMAERRLSVQLSGAYTELDGIVTLDSWFDQPPINISYLPEPFDPGPVMFTGDVPFKSEGRTFEALVNYRFASRFQVQGGYVDLGSFASEKFYGPVVSLSGQNSLPISFVPAPASTRPGLVLSPPPNLAALTPASLPTVYTRSLYNLEAEAWTLGLKADYPIAGKVLVYGRAGVLRATFKASDTFDDTINVEDPSDENGWYWGAGLQYPLHERVLLGGGFAQYDLSLQRFDSWQLSLELMLF